MVELDTRVTNFTTTNLNYKVMEAKELMTGDIVRVAKDVSLPKGTIVSVRGIDPYNRFKHLVGSATCLPINSDDGSTCGVWVEYLEPIPLTTEILEKNGFKRDPLWHHCDKDFDNYSISIQLGYANRIEYIEITEKVKDNFVPSKRTKLYLTHIEYFHQLQQIMRPLGIEKEIIL